MDLSFAQNAASAFPLGVRILCEKKTRARPTRYALRPSSKIDFPGMRALLRWILVHRQHGAPPGGRAPASLARRGAHRALTLMVTTRRAAAARARAAAIAFSRLSGDEQGIILGQLSNALEPRLVMYFSSANKELRALLPPAARQQLRDDYEEALALCVKMGYQSCRELREAWELGWEGKGPSEADLATLGTLGAVLPALEQLWLDEAPYVNSVPSGSADPDGLRRLAEGLVAGSMPALTTLCIANMHLGDAGASALAAALDRGALPRLKMLDPTHAAIGDAGLAALAPALRRRPALEQLGLTGNTFGNEGLAALLAPWAPAGTSPPPAAGLKKLKHLDLSGTRINDAGCATLVAALDGGALPALAYGEFGWELFLDDTPASDAASDAVYEAIVRSRNWTPVE